MLDRWERPIPDSRVAKAIIASLTPRDNESSDWFRRKVNSILTTPKSKEELEGIWGQKLVYPNGVPVSAGGWKEPYPDLLLIGDNRWTLGRSGLYVMAARIGANFIVNYKTVDRGKRKPEIH